jgi:hypothetical protein
VYSCFRAASTWFWSRLRTQQKFCCYYEIFNEKLEHLLAADVPVMRPDNWRSHHPSGAPYFMEFVPLLGGASGVTGFPAEHVPGSRFIGRGGVEGPLDDDVREYVSDLIAHARASGRVPVLTDPRLLARAAGFQAAFGGTHILLIRNLFEQWVSVCGQWQAGNDYFIRTIFNQLRSGGQDPFFSFLMSQFPTRDRAHFEDWARDENLDVVFGCYVASRIYLLLHARRHCDLVVDITNLEDPVYRAAVESSLATRLGVDIRLDDFERRIDYPRRLVQSLRDCRSTMAKLVDRALAEAGASADECAFANGLLEAVWRAHREFMAYTTGARELIECAEAQARSLKQAAVVGEREHARDAAALRAALAESQRYAESLAKALAESQAFADSLQARIARETAEAKAEREAMQASHREGAAYAAALENARRESEAYAESLAKALAESQAFADSLQARVAREAAEAKAEREAMQASQREGTAHAAALENARRESEAHALSLAKALAESQAFADSLQASQREAASHAAALEKALEESQKYAGSLKEALEESRRYADSLRARLDREAAEAKHERAKLTAAIAGWQTRHARMQRRFRFVKFLWPHETEDPKEPE